MTTLLIENPAGLNHVTPPGHPEQVARLEAVNAALAAPAFSGLPRQEAPLATDADLLLGHPQAYIDAVRDAMPEAGMVSLDPDTHASPGSWDAALTGRGRNDRRRGCGARRSRDQRLRRHAPARPPCRKGTAPWVSASSATVAIGALHALERRGLSRVAVVDFDVHHGNGTQDILWDEPRAFFASSHQMPLSPAPARRRNGAGRTMS
jgi:acetoin utilization deacetylase AcuC-like enzyme